MGGGTESFPDLGEHCQYDDCNQLDFLPFTCNGCRKVFCLEHRTYRSHTCPKADHSSRTVAVCDICSASIEKKANEDDKDSLSRHEKSGTCDPSKKRKPRCPVPRCKEILTFSNQSACKVCNVKVCLKHRFPSDHSCRMTKLAARTGLECKEKKQRIVLSSSSIKAF
ncbi:hypothetical protein KFK09_011474 [Dendrobium nobile]|uniref:AN1-type domain-containing protein n=1 Tax=Dendrobium nobile TaxID=94219 RepID=A0A8T3BEN1_DENNO|nr:hypothetical protein KFK09_011474 [Dendrobium nobile]